MVTSRDIGLKNYCENVYSELSDMRSWVLEMVKCIETMSGPEREHVKSHIPHLTDIANTIEWKLGVMMKTCPTQWLHLGDIETTASVSLSERSEAEAVAGGYVGG